MVSIAAFQAVDPGSIPGRRICFNFFPYAIIMGCELEGLVMAISCPWEFTHYELERNVGPLFVDRQALKFMAANTDCLWL